MLFICVLCSVKPPEEHSTLCKAFQYCRTRSRSIEINYENMDGEKILTRVNFQTDPAVRAASMCERECLVSSHLRMS